MEIFRHRFSNTVILTRSPTRQDGFQNPDKVYLGRPKLEFGSCHEKIDVWPYLLYQRRCRVWFQISASFLPLYVFTKTF